MNRFSIYTYVIVLLFVAFHVKTWGQSYHLSVISDVKIKHKKKVKSKELANDALALTIQSLRKKGFIESSVDSLDTSNNALKYYIHVGPKYTWNNLRFDSIPYEIITSIAPEIKRLRGRAYNPLASEKFSRSVLSFYENHGYPFATVTADSLQIIKNKVNLTITLSKGPLITVDSIAIKGPLKINTNFIYQQIHLNPGTIYHEQRINDSKRVLDEIDFIKTTRDPQMYFSKEKNILFLYLDKENANRFSGIIGFQNDPITDKLMITGDLTLSLKNVVRQGEWLDLKWNRFQTQSQQLNLNVGFPYVFKTPIGVGGQIDLFKQDSTFLDVSFKGSLIFNFGLNSQFTFSISSRQSNTLNTLEVSENLNNVSLTNYTIGMVHNKYDYKPNPRQGFGGQVKVTYATKKAEVNPNSEASLTNPRQYEGQLRLNYFIPLFSRQTIGLMLKGGAIINTVIYANEMYRLGGLSTLRGFNESSIYANQYAISTIEYRFLFEKNANFRVFIDGAYIQNKNLSTPDSFPLGFGLGFSIETGAGIFKLDYAMGKFENEPISFLDAKVHFGYFNTF